MRTSLAALSLLALTACGGAAETATPADGAKATVKDVSEKPSNPLDTSANGTACDAARREVGKRSGIFADIAKGTALPADGAKAAGELQKKMGNLSFGSGSIQTAIADLSDAYGRLRVSLTTGDIDGLTKAVSTQNAALTSLNKDCTSIGH